MRLAGWAREVLERPGTFATLATVAPDGAPHQAVVWYDLRDDDIVVNSAVGRRWPTYLMHNDRFSLMVEDGYDFLAIRGRAEQLHDPDQAQADIAAMARRYHADDPERADRVIDGFRGQERVSFLLHPTSVIEYHDQ